MALPDPLRCSGRLFLWPNCLDTAEDLSSLAGRLERPLDRFDAHGCVALHLDEKHVLNVLDALRKCLDPNSLEGTRAVFKPALEEPSLADVPRADSLRTFIAFARAQWLGDMISTRRLTAWFQPIVDARCTERVVAFEALARGSARHGEHRPVLPVRLLSAARDAGLMSSFDRYMHEQAIARFDIPESSSTCLFLNVTPRTLEDARFDLEHLLETVTRHRLRPERITLEIIECETIANLHRVQDVLTTARSLGFGIALDDLGAGFSNLNLVHQLRPDIVKLDMALIRNIQADSYKAVLAQKILEATRRLGVRTVAEGVERASELVWLQEHGVDLVQGYLIAPPAPLPQNTVPQPLTA